MPTGSWSNVRNDDTTAELLCLQDHSDRSSLRLAAEANQHLVKGTLFSPSSPFHESFPTAFEFSSGASPGSALLI